MGRGIGNRQKKIVAPRKSWTPPKRKIQDPGLKIRDGKKGKARRPDSSS